VETTDIGKVSVLFVFGTPISSLIGTKCSHKSWPGDHLIMLWIGLFLEIYSDRINQHIIIYLIYSEQDTGIPIPPIQMVSPCTVQKPSFFASQFSSCISHASLSYASLDSHISPAYDCTGHSATSVSCLLTSLVSSLPKIVSASMYHYSSTNDAVHTIQ